MAQPYINYEEELLAKKENNDWRAGNHGYGRMLEKDNNCRRDDRDCVPQT